ncbi:universal stress protein [Kitasatospora indigofera]|uniref:universal stress protein n=1 Tax=Kitasatospora indigofera TaxID=67307 RepID=UPI0033ACDFC6
MVLAWAADEANRRHLPVHVVQAWKPVTREVIWPRLWPELHDRAQLLRTAGEHALDEAARFIGERHPALQVSARLVDADPAEVLSRQAERAVVLVLGSRPFSGVRELFHSGAVTLPLIAHASCPVVVVPGSGAHHPGAGLRRRRPGRQRWRTHARGLRLRGDEMPGTLQRKCAVRPRRGSRRHRRPRSSAGGTPVSASSNPPRSSRIDAGVSSASRRRRAVATPGEMMLAAVGFGRGEDACGSSGS